jgi:hypothetical protein
VIDVVGTIIGAMFLIFVICILSLTGAGVLIGCFIKAIKGLFSTPKTGQNVEIDGKGELHGSVAANGNPAHHRVDDAQPES